MWGNIRTTNKSDQQIASAELFIELSSGSEVLLAAKSHEGLLEFIFKWLNLKVWLDFSGEKCGNIGNGVKQSSNRQ